MPVISEEAYIASAYSLNSSKAQRLAEDEGIFCEVILK